MKLVPSVRFRLASEGLNTRSFRSSIGATELEDELSEGDTGTVEISSVSLGKSCASLATVPGGEVVTGEEEGIGEEAGEDDSAGPFPLFAPLMGGSTSIAIGKV